MNVNQPVARPLVIGPSLAWIVLAVGAAALGVALVVEPATAYGALLASGLFAVTLSLGGGIFIATQAAAGATWWRPIARVPLLLLRALPAGAAAVLVALVFGLQELYPWARPEVADASPILQAKAGWLNAPFFLARAIAVLLVWLGFAAAFPRRVAEGGRALRRAAILFLLALGPTLSIAAWDWVMSLEPEWYSTMHGVTLFAAAFATGIAGVIVLGLALEGSKAVPRPIAASLRHDLGKLLFAFSCFWAYIWFCEYLLVWYANVPEEATHYVARTTGGWSLLFWLHPVLAYVVPFVVLMPVRTKKDRGSLLHVALAVLAGHWLGALLMVEPSRGPFTGIPFLSVLLTLALLAGMMLLANRRRETG